MLFDFLICCTKLTRVFVVYFVFLTTLREYQFIDLNIFRFHQNDFKNHLLNGRKTSFLEEIKGKKMTRYLCLIKN
jgi:hypothetical protein